MEHDKKEKRPKLGHAAQRRVSAKIGHLVGNEGKSQEQAAAIAYSMEREGKLGPKGGYRR